jgi:phage terminase large subunit-like protein
MAKIAAMTTADALELTHDWSFWARDEQKAPAGDWRVWLYLAGRGAGKTRSGAEWTREAVTTGGRRRIALVAPTAADARDVMVEGESGILAVSPAVARPIYEPSKRRLTWPNGAIATTYSADEPERLRGPQHDAAWCDELGAWRYPEAWDMLMFGLRLGRQPRCVVTTTPRSVRVLHEVLGRQDCVVTRGTSFENRDNLAPSFFSSIVRKYQGTRIGRQELEAELLQDVPGALWSHGIIEAARVSAVPELVRVVVAIDPAVTSGDDADETGIIVAGRDRNGDGYVLADLSGRYPPIEWARIAVSAYRTHGADRIVAEVNQGGDLVEQTIRTVDPNAAFTAVRASRGKLTRAEPISALYEQGRVHHLGVFPALEDQMVAFTPDIDRAAGSPDRADALVWALAELMIAPMASFGVYELYRQMAEEQETRELALIAAPDPVQQRHEAIRDERSRYAALMVDRMPTAEEAAEHVAAIDAILTGRPY